MCNENMTNSHIGEFHYILREKKKNHKVWAHMDY